MRVERGFRLGFRLGAMALAPVASLLIFAWGPAACSSSATHPPGATNCAPGIDCTIQPIPTSTVPETGAPDAATDADATTDGPIELAVTGEVRQPSSWGQAVDKGTLVANGYSVAGTRADGSTTTVTVSGGAFTLPALQTTPSGNWVSVLRGTTLRTLAWVDTQAGAVSGLEIPVFDDALPLTTASAVSLPVVTTGTASLVVRVVAANGAPVAGVTTTLANYLNGGLGYFGPYYDDGADGVTALTSATGAKGTLVFLGVDPSKAGLGLNVALSIPGVGTQTVSLPAKADAVSFRLVKLP